MRRLTRRAGQCTEDAFWDVIDEIGPPEEVRPRAVRRRLLELWDDEFVVAFERVLRGKLRELCESVLLEHEEEVGRICGAQLEGVLRHCVGRGRRHYASCLEDPWVVLLTCREGRWAEGYGRCFPWAPTAPGETVHEAMDRIGDEVGGHDDHDVLLMEAYERVMGSRARAEPRYYGAWARLHGRALEEIMDGETGASFAGDLPELVSALTDVAKNDPGALADPGRLRRAREVLERVEERRREIVEEAERRLAPLRRFSYEGCLELLEEIGANFGEEGS